MRIVGLTVLHYGKEYLRWAVASVAPFVERHIILYTARPSFGHSTALPCPDTEDELRACVDGFDHVEWHTGTWRNETEHRGFVGSLLHGEDILLPVDADEVWEPYTLKAVLERIEGFTAREFRVTGFVHFWRSFGWACTDAMAPVRIIRPRGSGLEYIYGKVFHFGYAQSFETVAYKWAIHGHKGELRRDCNWLVDKYMNWHPGMNDVHPTCLGIWNPQPFDREALPLMLRAHPYYEMELIE